MKLINPIDKDLSVQIRGVNYSIEAKGYLSNISKEDAKYWQEHIHNFLIIEDGSSAKKEEVKKEVPVIEEVKEVIIDEEPIKEEILEEVVEEVKAEKKSKNK